MTSGNFREPLLEQIANWSGWEFMHEQRRRVLVSLAACIICLFAIVFVINSYLHSSQNHVAIAEQITAQLRTGQESSEAHAKLLAQLRSILPKTKHVTHEFAGIIMQEALLQHHAMPSWEPVYQQLASDALSVYKEITALTEDSTAGRDDQALQRITALTQQSLPAPLHAYLLLEQLTLLRQKSMPTQAVLHQLRRIIQQDPVTYGLFTTIDHEGNSSVLEFFQSD